MSEKQVEIDKIQAQYTKEQEQLSALQEKFDELQKEYSVVEEARLHREKHETASSLPDIKHIHFIVFHLYQNCLLFHVCNFRF